MKKKLAFTLIVFTQLAAATLVKSQDFYFRIVEKNKNIINTTITQTVSIDKVLGDTVYAYANMREFKMIKSLGFDIEELKMPTANAKTIVMATSLSQMANWDRYPTYQVYREMLKRFASDYPSLCKLDSIGTSIEGRKIYVIKISDNVTVNEAEHEFYYTSTMHGDETTGFVLMLRLIDYLLTNYNTNERVRNIVNNFQIYINPNSNPDGTYYYGNNTVSGARRYNANNYDLNRNFPDPRAGQNPDGPHQIENIAQMDFASTRNFVLAGNFHGGIELANYPWDTWTSATKKHPDHNWYYNVSRKYADLVQANGSIGYFTGLGTGVTHGGDWYVVAGGRQDYMNYWHRCREVTFEISNTKTPSSSLLPNFWNYNREALLTYIEHLYTGIQGTVTNANGEPLAALITIEGRDMDNSQVKTNPQHGNYIRMIEPGTYNITYSSTGYQSVTVNNVSITNSQLVLKNVVLNGNPISKSVEIALLDEKTGGAIANATATITSANGSQSLTSNSVGKINLSDYPLGLVKIEVESGNYLNGLFIENITNSSSQIVLKLLKTKFDVCFIIIDENNAAIEGATVIFNGSQFSSNSDGKAVISGITPGKYTYRISKDGFEIAEKEIDVIEDMLIEVKLVPLIDAIIINALDNVKLWPNPFASELNIRINLHNPSVLKIEVLNIDGQKLKTIVETTYAPGEYTFTWNPLKSIHSPSFSSIYVIRIWLNGQTKAHRILFYPY